MKNVIFDIVPKNYGSKVVWQVNYGPTWERKSNWFWNKSEAADFTKTIENNESNPTYVCWYPRNENVIQYGDKILGHAQAEKNYFEMEKQRQKKLMNK